MRRAMKTMGLMVLVVLGTTACPRRVEVESEPNRYQATAVATIDITGTYDYTVDVDGDLVPGRIDIARAGDGYSVDMTSAMGEIETRNVRREGNRLIMQATTPGGDAELELSWTDRDTLTGIGYIGGQAYPIAGTRRP